MISVILSILKLILIILACIIGLILLILCLIFFVPIRYEADGVFNDKILAKGRISWLFRIFNLKVAYINEEVKVKFTIFGITFYPKDSRADNTKSRDRDDEQGLTTKNVPRTRVRKESNKETNKEAKSESITKAPKLAKKDPIKKSTSTSNLAKGSRPNTRINTDEPRNTKKGIVSLLIEKLKLIMDLIVKVLNIIKSILIRIYNFLLQIEVDEESKDNKFNKIRRFLKDNKLGIKAVTRAIKDLLGHIRPRKLKGDIEFGADNPATTGHILGLLSIFYGFYHKSIKIIPNFEEKILKGQVYFKGRIRLFTIAIIVIKLVCNKNFRSLWNNFNVLKEEL